MLRRQFVLLAGLVLIASLVTGCVSAPPRQSFNHTAAMQVKSIKVLPMRAGEPTVMIMNNPGYQFGLIGALVAEANMAPKRARLREQLQQAKFDEFQVLQQALEAALQQRGYTVSWPDSLVDAGKKTKRDMWGQRKTVGSIDGSDAQLDVNFGFVGYAAAGVTDSDPYRPTVTISARLLGADGKTKLFQDIFVYNNVFNTPQAVIVDPDQRFVYADSKKLDEAGAQTAEGLKTAIQAIAEKIAAQL
jgi:hypothetical protein